MREPDRRMIERLKGAFPPGTEVILEHMDDIQAPPEGARGKVIAVDDCATIHVAWDTGSTLGITYGKDRCRRV